jgi:hypothetical protein
MPDIPDPRMNPNGERAFGTVIHDKDGHHYVYIKTVTEDIETSSRYFTGSSQVDVGNVYPAFLVVPELDEEEIETYQNLDFDEKHALISKLNNIADELKNCIKSCGNIPVEVKVADDFNDKPVIFDLIEVKRLTQTVNQKIIKELNKEAKRLLKNK